MNISNNMENPKTKNNFSFPDCFITINKINSSNIIIIPEQIIPPLEKVTMPRKVNITNNKIFRIKILYSWNIKFINAVFNSLGGNFYLFNF